MTLTTGFLGYRFMGKAHANALDRLLMFFPDAPAIERSILIGRNRDAVEEAADRFGFARVETDWEAAIDDIDVLYNLGPNHVHVEPTVTALENDVHVFCEKPLAPTLEEARRMDSAARRSDALAGVAFNYRYVPAIQLAKRMTDAGDFGDIRRFRGQYLQGWSADPNFPWSWRNDTDMAGTGVLGDVGSHTIDLARWLVGDIDSVMGNLETFVDKRPVEGSDEMRPVTTDDEFSALVSFESGAMGVMEGSRVATGHKGGNRIEVYGSEGGFRFDMERLNELEVRTGDDNGWRRILVTDDDHPYMDAWWPTGHIIGWEHAFVHENYEFLSAIAEDGTYSPNFAEGLATQKVVDAVKRSHSTGSRITL
ncbi:Gfo/Idh/MocA family protein [Halegenticoccus soli]|uniref:Gfo/Idh/MocA family protein n=1 Tax=Halegenticoccus soli TaxID=1985678 RepID=UPI000C6EAFBD|nr:Gfo/Idh/MocA family oxidoreductase [Halegenticoccus soli]